MKTLGVTGGIGSGKTAACRILEDLGARVFYADAEGKRILAEDPYAREEVRQKFGDESYEDDGSLNRRYLAGRVFTDDDELERLNQIVHPRVFDAFQEEAERARRDGIDLLVHEAALIFEAGGDKHLDAVAVIDAPEDLRIQRVMQRDGASEEEVQARMEHQLPADELLRRADFVIQNDGSLKSLRSEIEAMLEVFLPEKSET